MGLAPQIVDEVRDHQAHQGADTTVALVEQDAQQALAGADRAYVMETGENVIEGEADELMANPRVVEAHLGDSLGG